MANERYDDKFEGQEEGEYHFSDDQANYELETDAPSKGGAATAVAISKQSIIDQLKTRRKVVIGIIVFIVLLAIVYKIIMPSSNTPATDFSQQAAAPAKTPEKVPAPTTMQAQQPAVQTTTTTTQQTMNTPPPAQPVAPTQPTMPAAPVETAPASKAVLDRISTLEQQNSAIMNLIQSQYTQRLAEAEAQNTQLRTQVQELTSRVSNMEVAFRQLTKILHVRSPGSTGDMMATTMPGIVNGAPQPVRVVKPRATYTVQAIIPGRAWLKSEAGDTVTVAEGDMLRGLGRITKIDPYDGIVNIDTGNKVITLSYGTSGD